MRVFRRTYFIYPEIQKPLLWQVFLGLVILSGLQAFGIYLSMQWMSRLAGADISVVIDYRVLTSWKLFLYLAIFIPMLINLGIGIFIVLFISNKFAGPLFRLERDIDNFLNDQTDTIAVKFRTTDYLHSLATKINAITVKADKKKELSQR